MHLQQLKRPTSATYVCHGHQNKEARPITKHVNTPLLLSVYATLTTACGTLDVASAAAAVQPQQVQTEHEVVAMRPNVEMAQTYQRLRSSGFDSALSSIVNVADTLSLATGELLDLTATGNCSSSSNSDHAGSAAATSEVPTLHIHRRGLHSNAQQTLVSAALSAAADSGREQLQEADPYHLAAMGVAHRMSQQALAVASEALKLAALLESQEVDPSYRALLQQIEEAARSVSVVAGDIAQPGVWLVVTDEQTAGDATAQDSAASVTSDTSPHTPSTTVGVVAVGPVLASAPSLDTGMQL